MYFVIHGDHDLAVNCRDLQSPSAVKDLMAAGTVSHFAPRMIACRLPVDQSLTHRLELEEINEGFDRLGVRQAVLFE